jgi:O-antigen ligase
MTDPLSSERPVDRPWEVATLAFLLFMVGVAGALSRKGLVPLLVITCLLLVGLVSAVDRKVIFPRTPAVMAGAAVLAWAALTNAWGMSLHIVDLLPVVATIGMSVFAAAMFAALPETSRLRVDRWLIAGSVVLVVFLIEEKLSGAKITTLLHPDPVLQIPTAFFPKIFVYAGGGSAVLAPTCVAVAALIYVHTRKVLWAVTYFVAAVIACAVMPMAAATLGAVLGGAAFVVAYYFRRFAFAAIFAGFAAYLIAAPAISLALPTHVDPIPTVPTSDFGAEDTLSIQARFATWEHVAKLSLQKPFFGHGFGASRDLSAINEKLPGSILDAIPLHPHNGPLQVWLELGAVGVLLVLGLLFTAWRATLKLDRPLAAAAVAGTLVAGSVPVLASFSLWNTWWLATLGFAAVFALRAVKAS